MAWTTPATRVAGNTWTAAFYNTYVRDNAAALYGDTAWAAATLTNSWVNAGISPYSVLGYRKVGTLVMVRGRIKNGTLGLACTTLPFNYRVQSGMVFPSTIGPTSIVVDAFGGISPTGGSNTDCSVMFDFDTLP